MVGEYHGRLFGFEDCAIRTCERGMSIRKPYGYLLEPYRLYVSRGLIVTIADEGLADIEMRQQRSLGPCIRSGSPTRCG